MIRLDPQIIQEAEDAQLAIVKSRIDNWVRCFADFPRQEQSITALFIQKLKEAFYDPEKDPDADIFKPSPSAYSAPKDLVDAWFLEKVWADMANPFEADLTIEGTNITVATAKIVIFLYAFAKPKVKKDFLKARCPRNTHDTFERKCLLFFYKRLQIASKQLG